MSRTSTPLYFTSCVYVCIYSESPSCARADLEKMSFALEPYFLSLSSFDFDFLFLISFFIFSPFSLLIFLETWAALRLYIYIYSCIYESRKFRVAYTCIYSAVAQVFYVLSFVCVVDFLGVARCIRTFDNSRGWDKFAVSRELVFRFWKLSRSNPSPRGREKEKRKPLRNQDGKAGKRLFIDTVLNKPQKFSGAQTKQNKNKKKSMLSDRN